LSSRKISAIWVAISLLFSRKISAIWVPISLLYQCKNLWQFLLLCPRNSDKFLSACKHFGYLAVGKLLLLLLLIIWSCKPFHFQCSPHVLDLWEAAQLLCSNNEDNKSSSMIGK
jgi:hypothetical protein